MPSELNQNIHFPLCVDCDGTLIRTDILYESALSILIQNPLRIFQILYWSLKGKTVLKEKLVSLNRITASDLPYNTEIIDYIKQEKNAGRSIILVTASHEDNAREIASFVGIFDDVFGTSTINLKGRNKADFLAGRFGENGFDYIGDSAADLPVWKRARKAILMENLPFLLSRLKHIHSNIELIPTNHRQGIMKKYIKLIRMHQWAKNLIIFIPLLTSHSFANIPKGVFTFFAFSLIASSTYIINDLADLNNDRAHHSKKNRPIAAGNISILAAIVTAAILFVAGLGMLIFINNLVLTLLVFCYIGVTLVYSFYLKKILLLDTIVLSLLYCIRLLAGHVAMSVPLSFWLLSFSIFFFYSLALAKRFTEIRHFVNFGSKGKIKGRGYAEDDFLPIGILGISSGMLSVSIFAVYLQSERVISLYKSPMLLVLLVPVFLYWISRVWILAYRGILNEDPVIFAIKDKISYLLFVIILLVIFLAAIIIV